MSNPIGTLQEITMKNGIPVPIYTFENITKASSPSQFRCQGTCNGFVVSANGSSKKAAKISAATLLLDHVKSKGNLAVSEPCQSAASMNSSLNQTETAVNIVNDFGCPTTVNNVKNAISLLQEFTVEHGLGYPKYEFRNLTQPSSGSLFECYGTCGEDARSRASASSKSGAKLKVAEMMYMQLRYRHTPSTIAYDTTETSDSEGTLSPNNLTGNIDLKCTGNAIGYLQEYTVKHGLPMPQYFNNQENESSDCIKFKCIARCGNISASMVSSTKKDAKLLAAQCVLSQLQNVPLPTRSLEPSSCSSDVIELNGTNNKNSSDNMFKSGVTIEKNSVSRLNKYSLQNKLENPRYNPMSSNKDLMEGYRCTKTMPKKDMAENMLPIVDPNNMLQTCSDEEIISKFSEISSRMQMTDFKPQEVNVYEKIEDFPSNDSSNELLDIVKKPLVIKEETLDAKEEPLVMKEKPLDAVIKQESIEEIS